VQVGAFLPVGSVGAAVAAVVVGVLSDDAVVILDDALARQVAAALIHVLEARSSNRKGN
jgi:hypothetical protein